MQLVTQRCSYADRGGFFLYGRAGGRGQEDADAAPGDALDCPVLRVVPHRTYSGVAPCWRRTLIPASLLHAHPLQRKSAAIATYSTSSLLLIVQTSTAGQWRGVCKCSLQDIYFG